MRMAALAVAFWLPAAGALAQQQPPHLTLLGSQLFEAGRPALERDLASPDPAVRGVAQQAAGVFRQARIESWARTPVDIAAPYRRAAAALGLDPDRADSLPPVRDLAAALGEARTRGILERLGPSAAPEAVAEAEAALAAVAGADGAATGHLLSFGGGLGLAVEWMPETGTMTLRAQNDVAGPDAFEYEIPGTVTMELAGDGAPVLRAAADPQRPPRALTAAEIEDRALSILGTWESDGLVLDVRAGDAGAGEVRRPAAAVRRDIEAQRARIAELRAAREFVWRNRETDELIRQERFRRLEDPWAYEGERSLVPDAEAQIAEAEARIARLEAELTGDDRPTSEKLDPVAYEDVKRHPAARALSVSVRDGPGCAYEFSDAWFDGRRLVARRTHTEPCSMNRLLPGPVMSELIAGWSPPQWLLLRAAYAADGTLSLAGAFWGMYVGYDPDTLKVARVFDPHAATPLSFTEGGGRSFIAYGAAPDMLP